MDVEKIVLEVHTKLMQDEGISKESCREMKVDRESGIDSLGIVSMVLEIEEQLGIELDNCLADIRRARTIDDIIKIVQKESSKQK